MHICLLTPSFPPMVDGGVAIATGRLVEYLLRRQHQVTVVTAAPSGHMAVGPPLPESARLTLAYGFVEQPHHHPEAVAALCAWAEARHRQHPFTVILAYFVSPAGYLGVTLGKHLGVPVVCSCRGNDLTKDMFIDPATIAMVLEHSAQVICVSDSLLRLADTLVPCRAKATVVANAVDCEVFTPAPERLERGGCPIVLGTSGVLRWKKGIDLLLPLIHRLCALHELRVLIAGYGLDAVIAQQLADFLRTHALYERVEITGPLAHHHIVPALQRMDLYVNTSYQEGMPNGVLEAMACALPVVATDADGTPALIQDGVTGYLCRMGDLEGLVARCSALLQCPSLRQRLGTAGRQRALSQFHPAREAAAVEEVLLRACTVNPALPSSLEAR